MRETKSLRMGIATGGLLLLALSQGAPAQDPAVVNAKTIQVKLENSRVRVLESVLAPGEKEKLHSHPASILYVIDGGKIRNHGGDGTTTEAELAAGTTVYRDPVTHWAENVGTTTTRVVIVELKDPT